MRFSKMIIVLLLTLAGGCQTAKRGGEFHAFVVAPLTIAKAIDISPATPPCDGGSSSAQGDDVCQINIDVSVDVTGRTCTATFPFKVGTKARHQRVDWIVRKPAAATYDVSFADFPSIEPILMRDNQFFISRHFGPTPNIYQAKPHKQGGTYYYIFLAWKDPTVENGKIQYCAVIDPIINNDDPI